MAKEDHPVLIMDSEKSESEFQTESGFGLFTHFAMKFLAFQGQYNNKLSSHNP